MNQSDTHTDRSPSRRDVLTCFVGGATALAGCSTTKNDSSTDTTNRLTSTPSPSPTDSTSPTGDGKETSNSPALITLSTNGDRFRAIRTASDDVLYRSDDAQAVLQRALNNVSEGGTVRLRDGVYPIPRPDLVIPSHVRLEGAGIGRSILKMAEGLNGAAKPLVRFTRTTEGAELADVSIDGNESNNRSIDTFPDSPPGHGVIVSGTNNTVENVAVHDTIRSNVVVAGTDLTLRSLELADAATDHWLYVTDAERCTIRDVTATGFARASGIVFGTNGRTCRENTLVDVVIEAARPTPYYEGDPETRGRFPNRAVNLRDVGTASDNTVKNVTVRDPQHPEGYGQQVSIAQPEATLRNLQYTGPAGFWAQLVTVGTRRRGGRGTTLENVSIQVTRTFDRRQRTRAIVASRAPDVTIEALQIDGATGVGLQGVLFDGEFRTVSENSLRDATLETAGPVIVADGSKHPVTDLALVNVTDVRDTGVKERGEVTYTARDVN
jgi:hypothetical protein